MNIYLFEGQIGWRKEGERSWGGRWGVRSSVLIKMSGCLKEKHICASLSLPRSTPFLLADLLTRGSPVARLPRRQP